MSVQLTCTRCPYFHPAEQACPPGWHDVQSEGGDHPAGGDGSGGGHISARTWQRWALAALALYLVFVVMWAVLS